MLGNVSPYINVTNENQWRFCRPNTTTKVPPQDPPNPPQCPLIGNPIDPSTGVKIQTETDYIGPDGLEFKRTYRSSTGQFSSILNSRWSAANTPENPLGSSGTFYNWTYQTSGKWFFARLPIMTDSLNDANHYLYTPDGTRLQFTEDSTGQPVAQTGTNVSVVKNPDPATQSVWLWEVTRADDGHERYDNQGRLVAKWPRLGEALTTTYTYSDTNTPSNIAPRPGLMIQITSAYDRSLDFTYNANGLLATMTDPDGGLYSYAYTDTAAPDNLTSVTYPDGHSKTYVYNEAAYLPPVSATVANPLYPHALTGIIDENNIRYATFTYDTTGKAISTEHAGGVNKHRLSFAGTATTVTDPLNSVATFNFQTLQGVPRLTGQSQPAGAGCGPAARNIGYDANGNITRRTDFNGNTTCYAYDLTRNLETVRLEGLAPGTACPADLGGYTPAANSAERKISTEWHPVWRVRTRTAEPKRLTTLVWGDSASQCGAVGVLCSKTQQATDDNSGAQGTAAQPIDTRQWHYRYNSRGQLLSSDGPRDNSTDVADQTDYAYYPDDAETVNNRKRLKTVTDSAGHVTTYNSYDAHGHPTQIVAANGVISDLNYTPRGKLQSLTVAGRTTQLDYTPNGLLWKITTPATGTTTYGYDNAQRLRTLTNAAGESIAYSLDNADHRTQDSSYANGATTPATVINRRYDNLGRLWQLVNAANQTIREYQYDAQGNVRRTIDQPNDNSADQQITDYNGYDTLNRLTQLTDALNGLTETGYDGLDHLSHVQDPRSNTTAYLTDGLDNLSEENSPDRGLTSNTDHDPAGNLKTGIDARGNTAHYVYDSLNRLLSVAYQPAAGSQPPNDQAITLNYRYDGNPNPENNNAAGQLTHIDDPTGATDWIYDSEGRLHNKTQTTGNVQRSLTYSYDATTGRPDTITYPSGSRIQYGYDSAGRISSLSYASDASASYTTLLDSIVYQPLGAANSYRLAAVTGMPTISRHSDSDGHIDSYTLNDAEKTLSYDRLGNIRTLGDTGTTANDQSYSYDALNRLTDYSAPGVYQHYDYDAGGNRTQKTVNTASIVYQPEAASNRLSSVDANAYSYDAAGNLTGNGLSSFGYDARNRLTLAQANGNDYHYGINALGQRVSKTGSTLPNGGSLFVYDEAGHLIGEYDNSGARIQEHLWLGDQPIAVITANGDIHYVLSDHLNTPRQIIDGNNQLRWRWDNLDPFGANMPNDNPQGLGSFSYNLRFPGQYYDQETSLFYNYFRSYDPYGGRYTQSDPIGLRGGVNTYGYVNGNPLKVVDPLGLYGSNPDKPTSCIACHLPSWLTDPPLSSTPYDDGADDFWDDGETAHPNEEELLEATCDDASWAIPALEALIKTRLADYQSHGGGNIQINPEGPGHKVRIKKLQDKLDWLRGCLHACGG